MMTFEECLDCVVIFVKSSCGIMCNGNGLLRIFTGKIFLTINCSLICCNYIIVTVGYSIADNFLIKKAFKSLRMGREELGAVIETKLTVNETNV